MSLLASLAFHAGAALVASYLVSRGTLPSAGWKEGEGSSEIRILLTRPLRREAEVRRPSLRWTRPAVEFPEPLPRKEASPLMPERIPWPSRPVEGSTTPETRGDPSELLARAPSSKAPSRAPRAPEPPGKTEMYFLPSLQEPLPLPLLPPADAPPLEAPPPLSERAGALVAGNQGTQIVPRYPERCRRLGHEGTVVLEVRIEASGAVGEARVVRSAGCPELDAAALEAVREATFEPAVRGGLPVASTVLQPVVFKLR